MRAADLNRWRKYFDARELGLSIAKAAARARISESTAYRF